MDKITLIKVDSIGVVEVYVVIDHGNGTFTSMLKSTYDDMIAQQEATQPLL